MVNENIKKLYFKLPSITQEGMLNLYDMKKFLTIYHNKKYRNQIILLTKSEKWFSQKFDTYQKKHLRFILEFAYKYVPFYHKMYKRMNIDIHSIKNIEDLSKLPVVTKDDILKNPYDFISVKKEKFVATHTSGTTGKPLHLRVSLEAYFLNFAASHHGRRFRWSNYDDGYIARFVGDEPTLRCGEKKPYRKLYFTKRILYPSYCMDFNNIRRFLSQIKKMNIKYLQTYPSTGYLLAKYLEYMDEYLPLNALYYSSEPLYDFQRTVMEERFQTKLFGFYGQAENLVSAVECEHGNYHLTMVDGVMEIVKNDEPVALGEKGFVVATTLHNTAMPLIRYKLGDYTGYKDDECPCGRNLPLIYPVETKQEDFVVTPSGKIISPSLLTFPLKYARNIIESQIVQKSMDLLVVRIVKGPNYTLHDEENMVKYIKEIVGDNMEIKVEYVKEIYRSGSYKKRFVINELGGDYIERAFETNE